MSKKNDSSFDYDKEREFIQDVSDGYEEFMEYGQLGIEELTPEDKKFFKDIEKRMSDD